MGERHKRCVDQQERGQATGSPAGRAQVRHAESGDDSEDRQPPELWSQPGPPGVPADQQRRDDCACKQEQDFARHSGLGGTNIRASRLRSASVRQGRLVRSCLFLVELLTDHEPRRCSADWQSAVSPTGSRRHSRLPTCATRFMESLATPGAVPLKSSGPSQHGSEQNKTDEKRAAEQGAKA